VHLRFRFQLVNMSNGMDNRGYKEEEEAISEKPHPLQLNPVISPMEAGPSTSSFPIICPSCSERTVSRRFTWKVSHFHPFLHIIPIYFLIIIREFSQQFSVSHVESGVVSRRTRDINVRDVDVTLSLTHSQRDLDYFNMDTTSRLSNPMDILLVLIEMQHCLCLVRQRTFQQIPMTHKLLLLDDNNQSDLLLFSIFIDRIIPPHSHIPFHVSVTSLH
ncbi:hypothetical protein PFISCL1PPCAC_5620, partial [Pristionchus fissidentatus]